MSGENIIIEHTLFAEPIYQIGSFNITNSLINSWLVVFVIIIFGLLLRNKIKLIPRGLQNFFETIIEALLGLADSVTGSREKSYKFFPLIFSFFIFILLNNWLGLLPGIGSIGQIVVEHGERIFVPWFRGGTADINTTIALAVFGVIASHVFGVIAIGVWSYFNKFVNIKSFLEIPKKIKANPAVILANPINAFIGIIEIVAEISKVASLSFRLFGNIFAGEVLLASIAALFAFGAPIPFIFLEILVGLIQALVFSILILSYMTMATAAHAEH
ncbi:MAG: F0F1 ATP synthase subunit A [bacterium]|nr:F0F1 ATP synthase subunit A [bacterium]